MTQDMAYTSSTHGTSHKHTCQDCGREQKVVQYATSPSFVVLDVSEEYHPDGDSYAEFEMGVDPEEHFKCIACGDITYFDSEHVPIGVQVTEPFDERLKTARNKALKSMRDEHEPEDFL